MPSSHNRTSGTDPGFQMKVRDRVWDGVQAQRPGRRSGGQVSEKVTFWKL